mmetsp:Transcript_27625/g.82388  ORF Transcript_27625/g.82388 Transcript_27625/m.82388 type:complete len:327 (-) Transcript_27625:572-1552(-)
MHDREDVLEGECPGQVQDLAPRRVGVVLHLLGRDAKQGVERTEEGAEEVVRLVAHLRHPPPQRVADEERRDQAVPHLTQSNQHEERDDRLGHDQEEVKLHCVGGLLPGLHWLAVRPIHALPQVLWHRTSPVRGVVAGGVGVLAGTREQLLVAPLLVLGRLLLLALAKVAEGALLGGGAQGARVHRHGIRVLRVRVPGVGRRCRAVVCIGGIVVGRLLLQAQGVRREGVQPEEGEQEEVDDRRQRANDDGGHQRDCEVDNAEPPQVHHELLDEPEDEGKPQAAEERVHYAVLEAQQAPGRLPGEGGVVADAELREGVPQLGHEQNDG